MPYDFAREISIEETRAENWADEDFDRMHNWKLWRGLCPKCGLTRDFCECEDENEEIANEN